MNIRALVGAVALAAMLGGAASGAPIVESTTTNGQQAVVHVATTNDTSKPTSEIQAVVTVDANGNYVGSGSTTVTAATPNSTSAVASNLVVKASAGTLYSFEANADSTLAPTASSTWYLLIFNATSLPANGAVTPAKCYQVTGSQTGGTFAGGGVAFSTGITLGASTTGCFTLTASAHALLSGDVQ